MKHDPINDRNLDALSVNMGGSLFNGLMNEPIHGGIVVNEFKDHDSALSGIRDRQAIQALIQTVQRR